MDQGRALKELDGDGGGEGGRGVGAHGLGTQEGEYRPHALAARGGEMRERIVQVAREVVRLREVGERAGDGLGESVLDQRELLGQIGYKALAVGGALRCLSCHGRPFF